MKNILVTGATGPLGMAVVENLLKNISAEHIRVLARNAEKAAPLKEKGIDVRIGDYENYDSLIKAFNGIETVYMISNNEVQNRITQQDNVVRAAVEAGVVHIVYTSFQRKDETASSPIAMVTKGHLNTEEKLKDSGITYTILQHGMYADLIPSFAGKEILTRRVIFLPAGDGKAAFVLRKDLAEAGANVLLDETGKYDNQTIELTGPEILSWDEIADIIGSVTNLSIKYVSPTEEEFKTALTNAGVPPTYVGLFANFSKAIKEGEFDKTTNALEYVLGHAPTTVAEYLNGVYGNK